jgi:hypothetical protein
MYPFHEEWVHSYCTRVFYELPDDSYSLFLLIIPVSILNKAYFKEIISMLVSLDKHYKTRDGKKVNILSIDANLSNGHTVIGVIENPCTGIRTIGSWLNDGKWGNNNDLIEVDQYADFKVNDSVMVKDFLESTRDKRYLAKVENKYVVTWNDIATSWPSSVRKDKCTPTKEEMEGNN